MKVLRKLFRGIFYTLISLIVIFALLYIFTSGEWEVAETVAQDSTISHITIDDIVFHSEAYGSDTARTTIVIHGGPGQDYRYLLSLKQLSDQYQVVFYDQRGTGLSPRVDPGELTLQSSIEDLDRIINYYSPNERINILGHSWGAMLGSAYLAKHPEKVNKIILLEPGFLTTEMAEIFNQRTKGFRVDITFANLILLGKVIMRGLHVRGPDNQAMKDFIFSNLIVSNIENHPMGGYFCNGTYDPSKAKFWRLSMAASQSIPQSQLNEEGKMTIDLVSGVEQYPDTVLFITGACNIFIGPDYQEKHLRYFPRHRIEIIQEAGHNMFLDQPDEFFKIVRDHLSDGS